MQETHLFCSQSVISRYRSFIAKYCQILKQLSPSRHCISLENTAEQGNPPYLSHSEHRKLQPCSHIHASECLPAPRARLPLLATWDSEWGERCRRTMGTEQPGRMGQAEKLAGSGLGLLRAAGFATQLLCLNTSLRVSLVQAAALQAVSAPTGTVQQS